MTGTYSRIDDDHLDQFVGEAQQENPNIVLRPTRGFLKSRGHLVQLERIRGSLLNTDPEGLLQRWSQAVRRQKYSVPGPLSLWHIDGNHKLIITLCFWGLLKVLQVPLRVNSSRWVYARQKVLH